MSHGKLREDHNCQNCGHYVEEHYCTHCGQENVETRQPFHFLFTHFIEDFVHYDGSFWQTIKKLFLKPGELTKEYLSGKRNSSVNPVKMYIFVSFVTFFLISVFPSKNHDSKPEVETTATFEKEKAVNAILDTLKNKGFTNEEQDAKIKTEFNKNKTINSLDELNDETLVTVETEVGKEAPILKPIVTKYRELKGNNISNAQLNEAIVEKTLHIIPKVLFVYMPLFGFLLWLFYNKKTWWYFDHGIFTLHYFTVILLSILVIFLLKSLANFIDVNAISSVIILINILIVLYIIVYFFIALYKLYHQGLIKSAVKGILLISINTFIFFFIVIAILIYSYMHI
ncbi:DUF3667 domain-containing protein [Empedobacter brevis]|uniref:DUF3667 domain-containing protein n=1 Tax=Empedobacter brevis TaxID=247 RepID=UPI0028D0DC12|nr:DUF3667 domain-containing protein [Empedobacter brevis]